MFLVPPRKTRTTDFQKHEHYVMFSAIQCLIHTSVSGCIRKHAITMKLCSEVLPLLLYADNLILFSLGPSDVTSNNLGCCQLMLDNRADSGSDVLLQSSFVVFVTCA